MTTKKPHILITNDDGVHAPGIKYLAKTLSSIAKITVVAPAHEQSAVGLSITIRNPLRIQQLTGPEWGNHTTIWQINGTPADCVKMALSVILDSPPDLVVSGINKGSNAGRNLFYSGTVAGVIEATLQGHSGIAFSCCDCVNPDYSMAVPYLAPIVEHVMQHSLPFGTLLNVNFPMTPKIHGLKLTRQGKGFWVEDPDKRSHPTEGHYYWLGAKEAKFKEREESDVAWLEQGYVTAVPVYVEELSHHDHINEHKERFERLNLTISS